MTSADDVITQGVGFVAVVRLWQVFPFDFGAGPDAWTTVTRVVLVGIIGTAIARINSFVRGHPRAVAS